MSAAHEPSMDEILRSIRRIIRSDKEEDEQQISAPIVHNRRPARPIVSEGNENLIPSRRPARPAATVEGDDNLIMMKIGDQNRLRILEQKLQTIERDYEQKLASQKQQAVEYYKKANELNAAVAEYKSNVAEYKNKLSTLIEDLRLAHTCLEKLRSKNQQLKEKLDKNDKDYSGYFVLQSLKHEIDHRYNPAHVQGDPLAKSVRQEVFNEFNEILICIRDRLRAGNF